MTLAQYLKANLLTHADFAKKIGVSQVTVTRYANRERVPRREHMEAIVRETNGDVKPDDFFLIPRGRGAAA